MLGIQFTPVKLLSMTVVINAISVSDKYLVGETVSQEVPHSWHWFIILSDKKHCMLSEMPRRKKNYLYQLITKHSVPA